MPSCIRAPPLAEKMISGSLLRRAYSMARVIFSPTAVLMLPMRKRLSSTQTTQRRSWMLPTAVISASRRPVRSCTCRSFSPYPGKASGSAAGRSAFSSRQRPSSITMASRCTPLSGQ